MVIEIGQTTSGRWRGRKYPWRALLPGQSFFVPAAEATSLAHTRTMAWQAARRIGDGRRFRCRLLDDGGVEVARTQ